MSKEHLQALIADVDRLVMAGASLAAGDEGLGRRGKVLREMGQKVPALAPVADKAQRLLDAKPKEAPRALLDLLLVTRQLRASLAAVGADGPLEPAPPSGPWETKTPAREIYPLVEALSASGAGRMEILKEAKERGSLGDLRLVDVLVSALGDGFPELADFVAEEGLPSLGESIVADLRRDLNLQGGKEDARKLAAICKVGTGGAAELCRVALNEGSSPVKVQALECLPAFDPALAEQAALQLLKQKPVAEVRKAAIVALQGAKSAEALEVLIATIPTGDGAWAAQALAKLPHPGTTAGLLADLQAGLAAPKENAKDTKEKTPKGKAAKAAPAEQRLENLLLALKLRKDPKAVPHLVPLLEHQNMNLREQAARTLYMIDDPQGTTALVPLAGDPILGKWGSLACFRKLPARERYERLAPLLGNLSNPKKNLCLPSQEVLKHFVDEMTWGYWANEHDDAEHYYRGGMGNPPARADWDPRWEKLFLQHLKGPNRDGAACALGLVSGPKAIPHLLRILEESLKKSAWNVVDTLGRLRAREALPVLLKSLKDKKICDNYGCVRHIYEALEAIGDPSIIPELKKMLAHPLGKWNQEYFLQRLIESLERKK